MVLLAPLSYPLQKDSTNDYAFIAYALPVALNLFGFFMLLIYSAWRRVGDGAEAFRRVSMHAAPVYPQSRFSVARRTALDRVMRELRVLPTAETPVATVTALLSW